MKHMIFVAGLALALSYPAQAAEPMKKMERPDISKTEPAKKEPAKKDTKKTPPPKPAEKVHCDLKKDPKCKDVAKKPLTKEEREAKKKAKEAAAQK